MKNDETRDKRERKIVQLASYMCQKNSPRITKYSKLQTYIRYSICSPNEPLRGKLYEN